MATRSTRTARTSIVAQSLADLDVIKAGLLPQGKTEAPKAKAEAKAEAPKAQEYKAPQVSAVTLLLMVELQAAKSLFDACVAFCKETGPISEKAWSDDIEPLFAKASKSVKCDAKRKAEFKLFLIAYSNGLRPKGADNFTSYVRLVRREDALKLLIKPSNRGAKPRTTDKPKAGATPKTDGKGLIGAEVAHANAKTSQLDHAQSLLGNRDLAAFLVRACETGNRDQLVKYLKDTFPTPKA